MAWLKNKPAGNEDIGLGDNQIRDNWEYLEDALKREHDFPGTYGSNGKHNKVTLVDVGETPPSDPSGNNRIIYAQNGGIYVIDDTGQKIFAVDPTHTYVLKLLVGENKESGVENLAGVLKLWSEGDNDLYVQIAPTEQTESYTIKLPPAQGGAEQILKNDGDGNLVWVPYQQKKLLHVEDQRSNGAGGGLFEAGAWRKRALNTLLTNEIPGASLANDQITLPAGTYEIEWSAPGYAVNVHKTRLYDTTANAMVLGGSQENANYNVWAQTRSIGFGRFTLTQESVIELQHRCSYSSASGFGRMAGDAFTVDHETYAIVQIRKIPT